MLQGPFSSADHSAGHMIPDLAGTQMAHRAVLTLGTWALRTWHCLLDLSSVRESRWLRDPSSAGQSAGQTTPDRVGTEMPRRAVQALSAGKSLTG